MAEAQRMTDFVTDRFRNIVRMSRRTSKNDTQTNDRRKTRAPGLSKPRRDHRNLERTRHAHHFNRAHTSVHQHAPCSSKHAMGGAGC